MSLCYLVSLLRLADGDSSRDMLSAPRRTPVGGCGCAMYSCPPVDMVELLALCQTLTTGHAPRCPIGTRILSRLIGYREASADWPARLLATPFGTSDWCLRGLYIPALHRSESLRGCSPFIQPSMGDSSFFLYNSTATY